MDRHPSAMKQYQASTDESRGAERIRGTRLHRSTFIFCCALQVIVVHRNDSQYTKPGH
jgi:hypothetical protein